MALKKKHLFAQITKINAKTRTVSGIAMQEVVDAANEICLYDESKAYFIAWSEKQEKASGGKSKGNVRVMHTAKVAGRVTQLTCDDALKAFLIDTVIDSDEEWQLVEKGAYTGFSIGANFGRDANGKIIKRDVDGATGWVANPVEVSLVDVPCVPTALFTMVSEDGSEKVCKFHSPETEKSMYSVGQMASILSDVGYLLAELEWERTYEVDDSAIPDRLRTWLEEGAEMFADLASEETSEFVAQLTAAKAARAEKTKAASCSCNCAGCEGCTTKVKALAEPENEKDIMTPEAIKALFASDEIKTVIGESVKSAVTEVAKSAVSEALKTALPEAVKGAVDAAMEPHAKVLAEMNELLDAIGEQPAASKVVHTQAIDRTNDKGGEIAETVKTEPTPEQMQNPEVRRKYLTQLRQEQDASGASAKVYGHLTR